MKPELIENQLDKVCVSADFGLYDALSGPLGEVFRKPLGAQAAPITALTPFNLSRYRGQGLINLSYDDGLLDNFTHAAPLHLKHAIPANFAVIAKCLIRSSGNPRYMSPKMCRILHDLGFEISSHGLLHCKRLRDMTLKELHQEAHLSKSVIERAIGVPDSVTTYCVPFSRVRSLHVEYLHEVYAVVRQAGSAMNEVPLRGKRCVTSYPLTNETTFADIKALIDSAIENRTALVLMLHGVCPNDARPARFEVPTGVLDQVLEYIAQQGPEQLLPIRLSSLRAIKRVSDYFALRRGFLQGVRETWGAFRT